jgi:hypothetical protein
MTSPRAAASTASFCRLGRGAHAGARAHREGAVSAGREGVLPPLQHGPASLLHAPPQPACAVAAHYMRHRIPRHAPPQPACPLPPRPRTSKPSMSSSSAALRAASSSRSSPFFTASGSASTSSCGGGGAARRGGGGQGRAAGCRAAARRSVQGTRRRLRPAQAREARAHLDLGDGRLGGALLLQLLGVQAQLQGRGGEGRASAARDGTPGSVRPPPPQTPPHTLTWRPR